MSVGEEDLTGVQQLGADEDSQVAVTRRPERDEAMNITVCDLLSNRLTVSVGVDDTLDVLRQRIADETGLYISKFDMLVGDKDLTDVQQLSADEEVVLVRRDGWVQTEHFANRAENVIREKFRMADGGVFTVHFCTPNNGKASLDHVEKSCFVGADVEAVVHRAYADGRKAHITREPQAVYIEGGFPHGGENFRDIHAPWGTILPNRVQRGPLSWHGHIILECGHVDRAAQISQDADCAPLIIPLPPAPQPRGRTRCGIM